MVLSHMGMYLKKTVQKGSLQYHKEIVKAEKVVKVLNTIARKNRKEDAESGFSNQNKENKITLVFMTACCCMWNE